ncbi:MAG: hypothetical protein PHQ96_08480 [Candidatus Omnitrophica bacterium]|nr:hypothetical protein [Candidatus Omnitrophota bacterium]
MEFRKSILIFFFFVFPCLSLQAQIDFVEQPSEPPSPYSTELIKKDVAGDDTCAITRYKYSSKLSKEEIVAFYRDFFSSQGLKEQKIVDLAPKRNEGFPGKLDITLVFAKGSLETYIIGIYYYDEKEDTTFYSLNETRMKYALTLSERFIAKPQKLAFMPVYKEATQSSPHQKAVAKRQSISYLIKGDVSDVINFYLNEMPAYKWQLTASYPRQGRQNVYKALSTGIDLRESLARTPKEIFGNTKVRVEGNSLVYEASGKKYSIDTENIMPGVEATIEGATLIFEKDNNKKCIININQFQDSPEELQEEKIINPIVLEKYGNILLSVEYFE